MLRHEIIKILKTSKDIGSDLLSLDLSKKEYHEEEKDDLSESITINLAEMQGQVDPDSVSGKVDIPFIGWKVYDE